MRGASDARLTPLETARRRHGLKVALMSRLLYEDYLGAATFARRRRVVSTFGLRQMPAPRIGLRPTRIFTNEGSLVTFHWHNDYCSPPPALRTGMNVNVGDFDMVLTQRHKDSDEVYLFIHSLCL